MFSIYQEVMPIRPETGFLPHNGHRRRYSVGWAVPAHPTELLQNYSPVGWAVPEEEFFL
ncbi:hypothetical protein [[Phormidium] sp. ETS-05]|uniref:hypothetical protein n=1 Tax=[Phormidium] sp. ETS-05 TaxID=222819 RepID=UPI0018EF323F|nr:hypothetical protein [[Phormidium] sp. ETS-05]